ncbi:hypothetical protein R3P38DRAFT_2843796 [Favolaschia claudopus]|uniref:F-box domain-containing protein n=1 Tax=Favolaschia claudopus TaxID=2862362 RepID=A0AAW0E288_9AGAR
MHRALEILELLEAICAALPAHRPTLYSVALVCRSLSGPALDQLWLSGTYESMLVNLLSCMPSDLWEIVRSRNPTEISVTARRAIEPSDWNRFSFYASRVRSLLVSDELHEAGDDKWSPVFDMLSMARPSESVPLFPNLRMLRWQTANRPWFSYARLFLSSSLATLDLFVVPTTYPHLALLALISEHCPRLTRVDLFVEGRLDTAHRDRASSTMVSNLQHVRQLSIQRITSESAFEHLVQLPSLLSLTLREALNFVPNFASIAHRMTPFPALLNLNLKHDSTQFMVRWLGMRDSWTLESISYSSSRAIVAGDAENLFPALAVHCNHNTLTRLRFCVANSGLLNIAHIGNGGTLKIDTLRPLFAFHSLHNVVIFPSAGFDLDDDGIDALARAWPQLRYLELHSSGFRSGPSRVTLRGLRSFAKHCRFLMELQIAFDASVIPADDDRDLGLGPITQSALSQLGVEDSIIVEPAPVATYLSKTFPSLWCVMPVATQLVSRELRQQASRTHALWSQVNRSIQACSTRGPVSLALAGW